MPHKRITQPSKPIKPTEEPIIGSSSLVSHPEPGTSEILKRPSRWTRGSILECNNRNLLLLQPSHPPRGCFCPVRERCGCLTREISHSSTQRMLLPFSKRRKLSGKSFFDIIYSWSRYFRGTKKSMCRSVCRINELKMPDPSVSSFDPLILHPCGICASWSLDALLDYGCREEGALVEAVYVELGIVEENTPLEQTSFQRIWDKAFEPDPSKALPVQSSFPFNNTQFHVSKWP